LEKAAAEGLGSRQKVALLFSMIHQIGIIFVFRAHVG
jgi:hypothetical protein